MSALQRLGGVLTRFLGLEPRERPSFEYAFDRALDERVTFSAESLHRALSSSAASAARNESGSSAPA